MHTESWGVNYASLLRSNFLNHAVPLSSRREPMPSHILLEKAYALPTLYTRVNVQQEIDTITNKRQCSTATPEYSWSVAMAFQMTSAPFSSIVAICDRTDGTDGPFHNHYTSLPDHWVSSVPDSSQWHWYSSARVYISHCVVSTAQSQVDCAVLTLKDRHPIAE